MVTGEPPSTLDGGQCKVTVDFEAEVKVKLEGGAGGTPLFRLTARVNRYMLVISTFTICVNYELLEWQFLLF